MRVGSKFEVAGKNDEKAWKEIEGLLLLERTWSLNFQDSQPSGSTERLRGGLPSKTSGRVAS